MSKSIELDGEEYIRTDEALRLVRRESPSTLRRWVKKRLIEPPYKPTSKSCYWRKKNLIDFMRLRVADEDKALINQKQAYQRDLDRLKDKYATKSAQQKAKKQTPELYNADQEVGKALTSLIEALDKRITYIPFETPGANHATAAA